jgi:hypothetical protein
VHKWLTTSENALPRTLGENEPFPTRQRPPKCLGEEIPRTCALSGSRTFSYLTRGSASARIWAGGELRMTLRAIHPPPTSASSAPTTGPTTETGP